MKPAMFADRLLCATRTYGPLCVGIDPHPGRIPAFFGGDTPAGIAAWGTAIVELARGRAAAVKPQIGLFERHGPEGLAAAQSVCRAAKAAGLLVLADAKRGDIGSTAEGYARAYLADDAPFPCDAVTVNPYMGLDTLEPFLRTAEETGRGVIVLARTSNPGARDFQMRDMEGQTFYTRVVDALKPAIERLLGSLGWSGLMLVVGATGPDEAKALRAMAPQAPFLVPGFGAQGAGVASALAGFVAGPDGVLEGGLINASRSVIFPAESQSAETVAAWQIGVTAAINAAQAALKHGADIGVCD